MPYRFGDFVLDPGRRLLFRGGEAVDLGTRAFDILFALVRRAGTLVTKSEIMDEVWPGVSVEENNLTTHMTTLRRAIGCGQEGQRVILTVAGRGYRFVHPVAREVEAPAAAPEPLRSADTTPPETGNLPLPASTFVGREAEVATVGARLRDRRLLTLCGPGGVGKTRLALAAASGEIERFAHGVWLADLAPLGEARLVAEHVGRVLGAPTGPGRSAVDLVVTFLRPRRALLVLDNCEHVLDGVAELTGAVLRACPGVSVLATSRERLGVAGETVLPLDPLLLPDRPPITVEAALRSEAVRLYVARAADALGDFTLGDEDAPHVAAICRRLDGLPLAIELAAARLPMLKSEEIAARLANRFLLLRGGDRDSLPRHQTMRAAIAWSHDLLPVSEQVFFRRLAVFADSFSLDAATAVAAFEPIAPEAAFDRLAALVEKSLVSADRTGRATRYRLLQSTRDFAAEKLAAAAEGVVRRRMAEHLADFYGEAERCWGVLPTADWLARFAADAPNLRAAIDWAFSAEGEPALGVALVAVSGSLAEEASLQADLNRWVASAMPDLDQARSAGETAWVLHWATRYSSVFGTGELTALRARAIGLFREAGDRVGLAAALRAAALAMARPGEPNEEAFALMEEAMSLLRGGPPSKDLANVLAAMALLFHLGGDAASAGALSEQAAAMREALRDEWGVCGSITMRSELAYAAGDLQAAIRIAEEGVACARRLRSVSLLAMHLCNLAGYRLACDDVARAVEAAAEALRLNREAGFEDYAVMCLEHLALAGAMAGLHEEAGRILAYTEAHLSATGQTRERLEADGVARLRKVLGRSFEAVSTIRLTPGEIETYVQSVTSKVAAAIKLERAL